MRPRGGAAKWRGGASLFATVGALCVFTWSCAGDGTDPDPDPARASTSAPAADSSEAGVATSVRAAQFCEDAQADTSGIVADPELTEISGVVASSEEPQVLWVHNDSGSPNVIWAMDHEGAVVARFTVTGATAVDWEDIAISRPSSSEGTAQLYIADIGDNFATTRSPDEPLRIYRVPEPDVTATPGDLPAARGDTAAVPGDTTAVPGDTASVAGSADARTAPAEVAEVAEVAYPDSRHDAEALLHDPVTGEVFVVTKRWDGGPAGVYRLPADAFGSAGSGAEDSGAAARQNLEHLGEVGDSAGVLVTGGDVSADGTLVVLRTYRDVRLWDRDPGIGIAQTLASTPDCVHVLVEGQGEAVAFDPGGTALVTVREGEQAPLHWWRVPS